MHRLIQQEFRNYMGKPEHYETFLSVAKLLFEAFPKHENGLSLRNEWDACEAYVQHVLILCARWQEYRFSPVKLGDFATLTELLASCGW